MSILRSKCFIICLCALCAFVLVAPGFASTYKSQDGALVVSARAIDMKADALVASGKAHVHYADSVAKSILEVDAEKITVVIAKKSATNSNSKTALKSAVLAGPVKLVYTSPDSNGSISKITATADCADFDGVTNLAHLTGNVKIVSVNPSMFVEPAVMVGDKATVNLMPNPGPDDFRFRIESSPGVSTITVTPKPKENK